MIDNKANIFRVEALVRMKAEAEANDRAAEGVSYEIRAMMEAEKLERERAEF